MTPGQEPSNNNGDPTPKGKATTQKSVTEQVFGYSLLLLIVLTFIYYIFRTPDNAQQALPVVRLLAAIAGGISASLLVGNLDVVLTSLPGSKGTIKAGGGLAAFLLVFFLFLWGIDPETTSSAEGVQGNTSQPSGLQEEGIQVPEINAASKEKPFSDQTITALNSYLSLAIFHPDTTEVPAPLAQELNLTGPPLIFKQNNPVIEAIERFIIETGNRNILQDSDSVSNYEYAFHKGGKTTTGSGFGTDSSSEDSTAGEIFDQSPDNFYADSVVDERPGGIQADYAALFAPFQTGNGDADWTALYGEPYTNENRWSQTLLQYPKLSTIGEFSLTRRDSGASTSYYPEVSSSWLQQVIRENPDTRGLIGYIYDVFLNPSPEETLNLVHPCTGEVGLSLINTDILSPYVKFTDIRNITDEPIRVDSISYLIAGEGWSPYKLNEVTSRSVLFQNSVKKEVKLNVDLDPGEHIFVPIEFGLQPIERRIDTFASSQHLNAFTSASEFYFPRPFSETELSDLDQLETANVPDVTANIELSQEFKDRISPSMTDLSVPKFAVSSLLTVNSLTVDGHVFDDLAAPLDDVLTSMSKFFGFGSCPYLLAYDAIKGYWINLGPILYQRNNSELKDTEIYSFPKQFTKLRIEEREQEVSYIDFLGIQGVNAQGKAQAIGPLDVPSSAQTLDGNSISLKQGDYLEIDLEQYDVAGIDSIQFSVNGFYEPL